VEEEEEEFEFHVPNGMVLETENGTEIRYAVFIEISSPQALQEQLLTILDVHAANWTSTAFTGRVVFECMNDDLNENGLKVVSNAIEKILSNAMTIAAANGITSEEGHPIVMSHTLTNKWE
jgi:hypothetical protein